MPKVSELDASAAALTDEVPVNQGGATKKLSVAGILALVYPVGCLYVSTVSTDPATLFGFGTWEAFGAGRVLVGLDSGDTTFDTAEETGGSKTSTALLAHTHPITDPGHTHTQDAHNHTQNAHTHNFLPRSATTGSVSSIVTGTLDTSSTISGSNQPHIQTAVATNQEATAVNQSADTGITGAGSAGSGTSFSLMNPYVVVYRFKRTA